MDRSVAGWCVAQVPGRACLVKHSDDLRFGLTIPPTGAGAPLVLGCLAAGVRGRGSAG